MKQGKLYTKLILWIFLIAVVCYFGYYIFSAVYAPLTTASAIVYEAGSGSYTTGYVVRDESVVQSRYGITTMVVSEGERVSKGQTLATGYLNADAQDRQARITELENQLEQLKYAFSYSADAADQAVLDSEIQAQLVHMSQYVARRDMNSAADRSAALKGLILRRMSSEADNDAMNARIEALNTQLEALKADAGGDTMAVTADFGGTFSGTVDGYETVLTTAALETMTVGQYHELQPKETADDAVGKLVRGSTWYYVTVVPTAQTVDVRVGDDVPVTFASDFPHELVMEVHRLGEDENGSRLIVLSCDQFLQDATLLRQQSADVVFSSYEGLRVPKEAVRVLSRKEIYPEDLAPESLGDKLGLEQELDDGILLPDSEQEAYENEKLVGVFVVEGNMASWKTIEILHDNGESYVVKLDKSSTGNLWPGDEIIVGARNLYDGKVVR